MLDQLSNSELIEITGLSILVSGVALVLAIVVGIPAGIVLAISRRFPGKRVLLALVNTGMGLPPVVVGLVVALALFRNGPLGFLGWMYTVKAMVLAQTVIALPLVIGLTAAGVKQLNPQLSRQIISLGANRLQHGWLLLREARLSVLAAVMAGFGGALSEVGAVMMVGGNIRGDTRVLTTAIVQHTRMGHFESAVILGGVLLSIAFVINLLFTRLQQNVGRR